MTTISSLIDVFKGKYSAVPELELRFYGTQFSDFKTIYEEFAKQSDPTFECAVFIIDEISKNERDRREIYYKNGILSEDKLIKKKRLHKNVVVPNDYMKYAIGLSLETPIKSIGTKSTNVVRFRTRASFTIEHNGLKWRLDLTAIKSGVLQTLEKVLPTMRSRICNASNTKETFIDNILKNSALFDAYEVELEYIDTPAKITEESMDVATLILKTLNPKYDQMASKQETIYKIAS